MKIMNQTIEKIETEKIFYKRIIARKNVEKEDVLYENSFKDMHIFMYDCCVMRAGGYLILDFGREICGRVHIIFNCVENAGRLRVRLGESVAETCAEEGENNAGNYHSLRDCCFECVSWGDVSTSESGFRFVRIDLTCGEETKLSAIYAESILNGLTIKGDFRCDDERINHIYRAAEKTLALCVRANDIWDGIKRDRVMWIGDFYSELLGAAVLYGDVPQFQKVLSSIKDFDGKWVNMIPAYSAWWIISLYKYYELFGNRKFTEENLPYISRIIDDFSVIIKENGEVSYRNNKLSYFPGNEFFIDWPTNLTEDSKIGWRYLVVIALKRAKELYEIFGLNCDKADILLKSLYKFNYKKSAFKQVTALGVLAEMIPPEEARPLLKAGGPKGMTGFMGCIIIEALQRIGEEDFIADLIKQYYGAMLDLGATTLWEDFDIDWLNENPLPLDAMPDPDRKNIHADFGKFCYKGLRHSLCHGWSAGFIYIFYQYILGIKPLSAGYAKIKIEPHLCGLTFAEGKLPTVHGVISVKHEIIGEKMVSEIDVPASVEVCRG